MHRSCSSKSNVDTGDVEKIHLNTFKRNKKCIDSEDVPENLINDDEFLCKLCRRQGKTIKRNKT